MALLASTVLPPGASDCELLRDGLLAQPANAISSLAFVVVGIAIAVLAARGHGDRKPSVVLAGCLVITGLGSVAYHGPQPAGAELMHDLSIVFVLALIALHDISLLLPGFRRVLLALTAFAIVLTGAAVLAPVLAALAADVLVPIVIAAEVLVYQRGLRPQSRREQRRKLAAVSVALCIAGGLFLLGRTGSPACDPMSLLQPHAGWHVAAAGVFALWWWLALAAKPARHDSVGIHLPTSTAVDGVDV